MNSKQIVGESSGNKSAWGQVYAWISKIPAAWMLVLPLLVLIPTIGSFPYPTADSAFSDITISHYPNAIYLREAIVESGDIPLWSPTIMSGYPFAANPLSGLWYPAGWLALILPLPLGFNVLIGLHLVWGAIGLFLLMRAEGLGKSAALLAGLSFGLLPKLFAHYGAGHLTLLYAVSWTPWLLLSQRTYFSSTKWFKIPPGLVLGLIFLADVRWGAFALFTWWAYSIVHSHQKWWSLIKQLFLQSSLALLLAAPQLLPLIEYSSLSTRSELTGSDVLAYSLPALNLLGLLFPNRGTIHEWVLYAGGIVSLLALSGLMLSSGSRKKYFWGILCLVTTLVALGSQIPGAGWLVELPLVSLLRVPSRVLFLTGLGVASLAGYGTDAILNKRQPDRGRFLIMALFGICLFAILLFVGIGFIGGEVVGSMFWGTLGLILSAVWIGLGVRNKLPTSLWVGGVLLIAVIDLVVFDLDSFVGKDADLVLAERGAVAQYIANTGGSSRTYSPSYSIPQQTAIHHGIRMADGVDPLQIAVYSHFMDQASGVPRDGYSVTIPYFSSGQPKTDNAAFVPDAEKLGLLNVAYVVSDFELHVEDLKFERQLDGAFIYSNTKEGFSAWVQPGGISATDEKKPAEVVNRSPNRLEISATGPGTLIVSEIAYPGWSVLVDGVDEEMVFLDDLLMGVNLEPGPQRVEFIFRPRSVYIGMSLFVGGLVVLVWSTRSNKKQVTRG